ANKYQLIYVEGTRPTAKDDLEKITNNLNNMFAEIVKETIKNRRRLPKTLYLFGGTGKFELNVNLGAYRLNEINNANLPRKFSEMKDFVYFYECVMKWALLIRNVIESFDTARSGQRPSRLSLNEIYYCKDVMFPHIEENEMLSQFDRWGEIPRFVLEKNETSENSLENAIVTNNLKKCIQSIGGIDSPDYISH
ncbi:10361_t:CDS:2, partial [Entrophospora sp. SA101]